jgi:VanZ family protein
MLPLSYPTRWRIASIFLLTIVLGAAMAPDIWSWPKPLEPEWLPSDKLLHGVTFAGLAIWYSGQYARRSYGSFAFGLLLFGILIEACQSMVTYRTADTSDLLADVVGIAVGILIAFTGAGGWSLKLESWLKDRVG